MDITNRIHQLTRAGFSRDTIAAILNVDGDAVYEQLHVPDSADPVVPGGSGGLQSAWGFLAGEVSTLHAGPAADVPSVLDVTLDVPNYAVMVSIDLEIAARDAGSESSMAFLVKEPVDHADGISLTTFTLSDPDFRRWVNSDWADAIQAGYNYILPATPGERTYSLALWKGDTGGFITAARARNVRLGVTPL